jgi:hypothetical protein
MGEEQVNDSQKGNNSYTYILHMNVCIYMCVYIYNCCTDMLILCVNLTKLRDTQVAGK